MRERDFAALAAARHGTCLSASGMKRIMRSFLGALCETCGAERARLRVAVADGDRPVLVVDQKMPPAPGELWDHFSLCGEAAAPCGGLVESDGRREWRMRRSVNGFHVDVDLALGGNGGGFVNDRITRASAFLDLLESLLDGAEPPGRGTESPGGRLDGDGAATPHFDPPFVGDSLPMIELKRAIGSVAASDVSLLIEGESGTGKEVVARNVHRLSRRRAKPLVIASSLEMPHTLLQSELFGHAEGAFTGASRERAGLIESAHGGTFFLDEIGEMPLPLQAALLRVLQEKEVRRLGESRRRPVDARFVFATNRDLLDLTRRGRFRRDLYYRIAGVRLRVPPLRDRREDVLPLAGFFLARCAKRAGTRAPAIAPAAVRALVRYGWPGNVRELANEIERVTALHADAHAILPRMLSPHLEESGGVESCADDGRSGEGLPGAVRRLERSMIAEALRRHSGNRTRAAEELRITRQGLLKKLKRYGRPG